MDWSSCVVWCVMFMSMAYIVGKVIDLEQKK